MKEAMRYSDAFKRSIVEKVERGMYASISEAQRKNGIRGSETLEKWIKKYGRKDILPKRVRVETMNEIDELKAARKEIKELKAALADAHMDRCFKSAFFGHSLRANGNDGGSVKKTLR